MQPRFLQRWRFALLLAVPVSTALSALPAAPQAITYEVKFQGNWTLESTPGGVVAGAHFTTLIGGVHGSGVTFWKVGEQASPGVELVAELGSTGTFRSEVLASTHTLSVIQQGVSGGGTGSATFTIDVTRAHPLVTLLSMIGPSPDWFVGIHGRSLRDGGGQWLDRLEVDLFPYDAGTEEGTEFSLDNPATVPRGTITSIRGVGRFTDRPMARLTFERLGQEEPGAPDPNDPEPRFTGDVAAEPAEDSAVIVFWRGSWADAGRGLLSVEARSQTAGWAQVTTADASDGRVRIDGLRSETPYTFRLRASGRQGFEYSEEASATTGGYSGPCRVDDSFLCLRDGRFEARVHWANPDVPDDFGSGVAIPVAISDESGLFWFFDSENVELVVKVLDGRVLNGKYWVFYGALSDVEYWITVRDTVGGLNRTYHNPPRQLGGQRDLEAF